MPNTRKRFPVMYEVIMLIDIFHAVIFLDHQYEQFRCDSLDASDIRWYFCLLKTFKTDEENLCLLSKLGCRWPGDVRSQNIKRHGIDLVYLEWRHFADDILKSAFLNENIWISLNISLKFIPKGPINNIPASAQIMAWRRPGDKPLSEPMMAWSLTHICVTRPQWVKPH